MKQETTSLTPEQMATLAVNLLNQRILEAARTEAKQVFRVIEAGDSAPITNLRTEDGGLIRVELSMDASAFVGALNFSAFRDGVMALLAQLTETLRGEASLKTFSPMPEEGQSVGGSVPNRLFAAGGVTTHDGDHNVLMLGVTPDSERPVLTLQLMYIDPSQFQSASSIS